MAALLAVILGITAAVGFRTLVSSSPAGALVQALRSEQSPVEALPGTVWPAYGQAAVQIGSSRQAGPNQHPAPIASVTKVMTA